MRKIKLREWRDGVNGYVWTHCGDGELYPVRSVSSDWWIGTGGQSFCSSPSDTVYVYDSHDERAAHLVTLRAELADNRARFDHERYERRARRDAEIFAGRCLTA